MLGTNIVRLSVDFYSDYGGRYREEMFLPKTLFDAFKSDFDFELVLYELSGKHSEDYVDIEVEYFSEQDMRTFVFDDGYYSGEYLFDSVIENYGLNQNDVIEFENYVKGLGKVVVYEVVIDEDHVGELENLAHRLGFSLTLKN